jgi:hypothetical protein
MGLKFPVSARAVASSLKFAPPISLRALMSATVKPPAPVNPTITVNPLGNNNFDVEGEGFKANITVEIVANPDLGQSETTKICHTFERRWRYQTNRKLCVAL